MTTAPDRIRAAWPTIEGIDIGQARRFCGGDADLFLSLLERLLGEFADVAAPSADAEPAALAHYARAMHKLRGGACLLGAREIEALAADLETACRTSAAPELSRRAATLDPLLQNLRQGAGPALAAARARRPV